MVTIRNSSKTISDEGNEEGSILGEIVEEPAEPFHFVVHE